MNKKIIFSSGGTGGHIFPAINLMKYLQKKGYDAVVVTDKKGENFLDKDFKFKNYNLNTSSPLNKNIIKKLFSYLEILFSIIRSISILLKERPALIIGFGGYVSFPICFASIFFKIPLIIYENNLILGRANQKLLFLSKKILLGTDIPINFPNKYKNKISVVGNILKEEIINNNNVMNFNKKSFSILVIGGSQGAEVFGKVIPSAIKKLHEEGLDIEVNQQCIENQEKILSEFYKKNNIKNNIFKFKKNILELLNNSDIAISRSGASSSAELICTLTPFIAVPYPYSMDNHQYLNAKYYEKMGYCWVIEENEFNSTNLFNLLLEIIKDKKKLADIHEKMKKSSFKEVYNKIENVIRETI